jgi:hypothetical protein
MDNEPSQDTDIAPDSAPEAASYALTGLLFICGSAYSWNSGSAIFSGSHFTVTGGTFYNITRDCTPPPTEHPGMFLIQACHGYIKSCPDFRKIPLGDINLQREIRFDSNRGFIENRPRRQRVSRMYTAKLDGRNSDMTVAIYQGKGAEEVCGINASCSIL